MSVITNRATIQKAFDASDDHVERFLQGSKTHDFASIADGANASTTVTVTGAAVGDFAIASVGVAVADGGVITARVSAADTVTVVVQNESGAALDIASTTLRALVIKAA